MPINYPVSVDTLPTNRQNRVRQPVDADDINDIARYANAIGAELGANPSGLYTDVAARLTEFRKSVAGIVSDASFTAMPTDGAIGVNTTENQLVFRSGGQWYGLIPPPVPDFAIVVTAGTAYALDKRGAICFKSASRDSAAVLNSALTTAENAATPGLRRGNGTLNATGIVQFSPQNHDIKSVANLPPVPNGSTPDNRQLRIIGRGAKFTLAAGTRYIGFGRTADYDTLANVEIDGGTIDASALSALATNWIIGVNSSSGQRINISNVQIRNIKTVGVPLPAAGAGVQVLNVLLYSYHLAAGEGTTTTVKDVVVEDCEFNGGSYGVLIGGSGGTTGVEVFYNRCAIRRCRHDTGTISAGSTRADQHFQIGSRAYGGRAVISNCYGANSGDAGISIDNATHALIEDCEIVDAWNAAFQTTNFRAPQDAGAQVCIFQNCKSRNANLSGLAGTAGGSQNGFYLNIGGLATYGHVILRGCSHHSKQSQLTLPGYALRADAAVSRITIEDFDAVFDAVVDTQIGSRFPSFIYIAPTVNCSVRIKRVRVKTAGSVTNGLMQAKMLLIGANGAELDFDIEDVAIDWNVTGVTAGQTYGFATGAGLTGTMRGTYRRCGFVQFAGGDTTPHPFYVYGSGTLTINGEIRVEDCDCVKLPGSSAGEVEVADNTNKAKVNVIGMKWRTFPKPSAAMGTSNFASATWTTATANQYIGGSPAEIHFANGSGAGITKIEASKDGTTYEAIWDQASGAMAQDVLVAVDNGDFLRLTYATTAPTTRVRFRR